MTLAANLSSQRLASSGSSVAGPDMLVVFNLEQFRSIVVVGLNQQVAFSLSGQSNPTVGCQHDAFRPLESDA